MKPLVFLLLVIASLTGYAQTQTPKNEFAIVLSQNNVDIAASESKEIEIKILRSKSYLKSTASLGLSSSLPKGIDITFSQERGDFKIAKVVINSSEAVVPGPYSIVINATLNGKTKGTIMKLNVTDKVIASDGKL